MIQRTEIAAAWAPVMTSVAINGRVVVPTQSFGKEFYHLKSCGKLESVKLTPA